MDSLPQQIHNLTKAHLGVWQLLWDTPNTLTWTCSG